MSLEEFETMKQQVKYDFVEDNHFAELKQSEIVRERLQTLNDIENHTGVYFSKDYVRRHILRLNDEEIKNMQTEMDNERSNDDDFGPGGGGKPDAPWNQSDEPGEVQG